MSIANNRLSGPSSLHVEHIVHERYSAAANVTEHALCCPIAYDQKYLEVLPPELLARDYGCGDPSRYVAPGETVLDLGSGGGKICYIASQIVGPNGHVIGVDMNDEMLALARRFQADISTRIGWDNVRFHKGRIQDLALNLEVFERHLREQPIQSVTDWTRAQHFADQLRLHEPMISNDSIDVVLSNCVLNLVDPTVRQQLFQGIYRVLRPGGRAVISDIVSDQPVPLHLRSDATLWSGCLSGAFVDHEFIREFERAGFHGIELIARQSNAWATVEGIDFRSVTVRAFKSHNGPSLDRQEVVVYRGPWQSVMDEAGNVLPRGVRTAVSHDAYRRFLQPPYIDDVISVSSHMPVTLSPARSLEQPSGAVCETGEASSQTTSKSALPVGDCRAPNSGCC